MPLASLSAEELRDFVETSTVGLHAVGGDGTILWANPADWLLLGYTRDEYVGHNIAEFHADFKDLGEILGCLLRGERLTDRKAVLRHKDGSLRHVLIDSSALFADGRFVHTRCFTRDVTQWMEQVELNEAMIRAQSELGDGVVVCDNERVYWANDAYCALLGYSPAEVTSPSFNLNDRVAPDSRASMASRGSDRAEGSVLQHRFDTVLLRKDGSRVECDVSVKTLASGANAKRIAIVRDVTRRKEEAREVREQRDMYDALLRSESDLGEGVLLTLDGAPVYANDAFARMAGRSVEALKDPGFRTLDLFPPGEVAVLAQRLAQVGPGGRLHYETKLVRPDGALVHVEVASVGFDLRGRLHRLALCRDVTREREDQTRLAERDAFLTRATLALLETTLDPDATLGLVARLATEKLADAANIDLLTDAGGLRRVVIAHADPAKQALVDEMRVRFPPPPQVRRLIESIPRGTVHVNNDVTLDVISKYASDPDELRLAMEVGYRHSLIVPLWGRKGLIGSLTLTRAAGSPYNEEDAFVAKSLAARAGLAYENAMLHEATRALESESRALYERLQRVVDTAPAQVLMMNEEGCILSIDRSLRGSDPRLALQVNAFDTIVPEDRERVRSLILESMREGKPTEYETQGILGPGQIRWFHVRVGPIDLDGGKGAVLISTDIDEKKRVEREIATMRAQLIQGEKLSALGSLVSGVAHELRTPLTFLSNNAYLLTRRLDEATQRGRLAPDARREVDPYLAEIGRGVERIDQLVEDLRRYTKARHDAALTVIPLNDAVADPIEIFRATNLASHVLELDLAKTSPIQANVGSLQQIVLNLLQNASDATRPGGTIRISTRDESGGVMLEVRDEGQGITQEVQQRMFEPLFTTKRDGTGLGLSIVKRIADEHRAVITCESVVGRGTTFRIRFPAWVPPESPAPA